MRVYCLTSLDELAPYADEWERLAAGAPFRGWAWLSTWWRHYGPQSDAETVRKHLATLCVFDNDDALVGIAPWYLECSAMRGRVLRPLGSGEVCSEYSGILCLPGREEAVVESLAEFLLQNAFDEDPEALHWDLLHLDSINAEDREVFSLVEHLSVSHCLVHRRPGMNCWRLELPADWDQYLAVIGKKRRRNIRNVEKGLLGTERATLRRVQTLDELPQAMDILVDLHQRRRKSLGDVGCFASQRFLAFHRDVVSELLRRGQLLFCWLELDGKPVAAEYLLVGNGIAYAYQSGVAPEMLEHQPGNMINVAVLKLAIAGGYRMIDYLRGDEQYKSRLGAKPHPTVEFRVAPALPAARLRHNLWIAGRSVKDWMKTMMKESGGTETEMEVIKDEMRMMSDE